MHIGERIKQQRKELGLTQQDLAKNITTQTMISKIENGQINPSVKMIEKIIKQLGIDSIHLLDDTQNTNKQLDLLEERIRRQLHKQNFREAERLMLKHQSLISKVENEYYECFFNWINQVLAYFLDDFGAFSIEKVHDLLESSTPFPKMKFSIHNFLGNVYSDKEDFEQSTLQYELALQEKQTSYEQKTDALYNLAHNLMLLGKIQEALDIVIEGIDLLVQHDSMFNLGYFYFLKGYLLGESEFHTEALEAYENALIVFRIKNYTKMMTKVKFNIKEIKMNAKKNQEMD